MYDVDEMIPMDQEYLAIVYFELLKPRVKNRRQEIWRNYFLGEELPDDAPEYIRRAARIIDVANLSKEELHMLALEEKYRADQAASHATARLDGIDEGLIIGRKEGEKKGLSRGRKEGEEKGLTRGRKEGASTREMEIARNMKEDGNPTDKIAQYTGLSEEAIAAL